MITFGYNNKFSSILRALSAIGIGGVMLFSNEATITVVKIIAAFLFAAGIVSFIYGYVNRRNGAMSLMSLNAVVDIIIGLLLFFFPEWVAGAIVTIVGIVILIFGAIQLIALAGTMSLLGRGGFPLLFSILALIGGIMLVFNPFSEAVMSVLAGNCLVDYGISELISAYPEQKAEEETAAKAADEAAKKAQEEFEIHFNRKDDDSDMDSQIPAGLEDVKDAEYHKVDEQ